ncbi:MAG: DUF3253 domain-containing protein [Alphaproteobacteria bacterium]|nr:DUF3253 domain-containing protein [Alphaproteobacteria bacterium]
MERSDPALATRVARETMLALLAGRAPGATVCPSEVARTLGAESDGTASSGWRDMMPVVHAAVDQMMAEGLIRLSWKGKSLKKRAGPYRIGRGKRE